MESDQMNGQWEKVDAPLPYREGYAMGGLLIVDAYDPEEGLMLPDRFEVRHRASDEFMIEIEGTLQRAQEIAADLATIADWELWSTVDELTLQAEMVVFAARYPGEVVTASVWLAAAELDRIVPYGR
jgi:hypothetical protein